MTLTVPSKFLLPSPVKLCGTVVKAAQTGRLCNYGAEKTEVSWVMTALSADVGLKKTTCKYLHVQCPATSERTLLRLKFPGSVRSPTGKKRTQKIKMSKGHR